MPTASIILRANKAYRREQFAAGLARVGYEISDRHKREPDPGDLLILWNRIRSMDPIARRYEMAGARVIIAENGYLPDGEAKTFALAIGHHNGGGRWPAHETARREFPLSAWRAPGDHILVLAQRGIGEIGIAQPHFWTHRMVPKLRTMTGRPIRIRAHPGPRPIPLDPDLDGAHAVITWASGAALKAICAGVPCFHGFPGWIGAPAALPTGLIADRLESPRRGDRRPMLARLSWAQWREDEITSGEAFAALLGMPA